MSSVYLKKQIITFSNVLKAHIYFEKCFFAVLIPSSVLSTILLYPFQWKCVEYIPSLSSVVFFINALTYSYPWPPFYIHQQSFILNIIQLSWLWIPSIVKEKKIIQCNKSDMEPPKHTSFTNLMFSINQCSFPLHINFGILASCSTYSTNAFLSIFILAPSPFKLFEMLLALHMIDDLLYWFINQRI